MGAIGARRAFRYRQFPIAVDNQVPIAGNEAGAILAECAEARRQRTIGHVQTVQPPVSTIQFVIVNGRRADPAELLRLPFLDHAVLAYLNANRLLEIVAGGDNHPVADNRRSDQIICKEGLPRVLSNCLALMTRIGADDDQPLKRKDRRTGTVPGNSGR